MPVAFIGIVLVLLFLMMFRKVKLFGIERLFLVVELLLILSGFFIEPIDVLERFRINVMFSVCVFVLMSALFFKVKGKYKLISVGVSCFAVIMYFLLITLNSDYLTFLTYVPLAIIVFLTSLILVKNFNASVFCAMFSFLLVEILNYVYLPSSMGYLTLFSVDFINSLFLVVLVLFVARFVYLKLKEHLKKPRRVVNETN